MPGSKIKVTNRNPVAAKDTQAMTLNADKFRNQNKEGTERRKGMNLNMVVMASNWLSVRRGEGQSNAQAFSLAK